MSEGHEEQAADVRSFLPRPGEPVERYADRLRALHRDLTLVLEAAERGLAVTGRTPTAGAGADADHAPIEAGRSRAAVASEQAVRARVEVVRSAGDDELEQLERGVERRG